MNWQLGRIHESMIHGEGGLVRKVIVRTANGLVQSAIVNLAPLPIETEYDTSEDVLMNEVAPTKDVDIPTEQERNGVKKQKRNESLEDRPVKKTKNEVKKKSTFLWQLCLLYCHYCFYHC
jgi:hypothetical protein